MKICRIGNWNKINTKTELIELLQAYRGILNNEMIDYLNSLINLEFSVIRDNISNSDRIALTDLKVYKRIAMYNIYNRALNVFLKFQSELEISGNNNGIEGLTVYGLLGEKRTRLFDFDYRESRENLGKIPIDYETKKIGDISIFKTIENVEKREAELDRVMSELEKLYSQTNPHPSKRGVYGGPASQWSFAHSRKIKYYEEKFQELDAKKSLTDEDLKEIEITKKFHELLLSDYGLTDEDFEEENKNAFKLFNNEESEMHKKRVKKLPGIKIVNNISYM